MDCYLRIKRKEVMKRRENELYICKHILCRAGLMNNRKNVGVWTTTNTNEHALSYSFGAWAHMCRGACAPEGSGIQLEAGNEIVAGHAELPQQLEINDR